MSKELFHQHLLIRAYVKNPPTDESTLNQWMTELIDDVKMEIAIEPRSYYVTQKGNEGLTGSIGLANIQTSHFAIHVWSLLDKPKVEMDLYSCAEFEVTTILDKLKEWGLDEYHYLMVDRNEVPFRIIEQCSGVDWDFQN